MPTDAKMDERATSDKLINAPRDGGNKKVSLCVI